MFLLGLCLNCNSQDAIQLFDGKTLNGWKQLCGDAKFSVVDGTILGVPGKGNINSFLVTEEEYDNFLIDFDFKTNNLNSGVQLRSHREKWYHGGRVYGYQFEIDPFETRETGGIYYESAGIWLYSLMNNPQVRNAYHEEWNHGTVLAVNDTIRTWVNGIECSFIIDSTDRSGFIALQVHKTAEPDGKSVQWRDIYLKKVTDASIIPPSTLKPITTSFRMSSTMLNYLWIHKTQILALGAPCLVVSCIILILYFVKQ